jgi:hypothetical protein
MAAGQGFKTFATGDVLSAADVNGYLMQGVLVFADSAERDAEITSPEEGQFAFLKDTNVTTYYTGSAWANLDTTGMTNPMTTTGDTIYSSSGSTPARLGIGSTGQVLTVASGVPSWASPASGGGMTLIESKSITTSATYNFTSIPSSYINLVIVLDDGNETSGGYTMVQFNGDTASNYNWVRNVTTLTSNYNNNSVNYLYLQTTGSTHLGSYGTVFNYNSVGYKTYSAIMQAGTNGTSATDGGWVSTSAITSMLVTFYGAPTAQGTLKLYGVK